MLLGHGHPLAVNVNCTLGYICNLTLAYLILSGKIASNMLLGHGRPLAVNVNCTLGKIAFNMLLGHGHPLAVNVNCTLGKITSKMLLCHGHPLAVNVNCTLGYICNIMLAYLILSGDKRKIGNYRFLLLVLSIFDMIYATAHLVIMPVPLLHGYTWSVVQTGSFFVNHDLFHLSSLLYCSLFNQSVVLLMFHFVYRYVAICKCHLLPLFGRPLTIIALVFIYVGSATLWAVLIHLTLEVPETEDFARAFEQTFAVRPNTTELVGGAYFIEKPDGSLEVVWKAWLGLLLLISMLSATFIVIIYCAYQTKVTLNRGLMSSKSHQLQMQLYKALLIQMCVPLIFEYTPCTAILLSPALGFAIPIEWTMNFFSAYPILEPLVVIYFVKDYRKALLKLLRIKRIRGSVGVTTSSQFATNDALK